jgi:hypothetical protein
LSTECGEIEIKTVFRYTFECTTNSKLFLVKLYERRKNRDLLYTVISGEKLPVKQLISGKFLIFLENTGVSNNNRLSGLSTGSASGLDFLYEVHATGDFTEHHVSLIEPGA